MNTQILKLHKSFANNSSATTKLSKTHLHKIGQWRGFLGRLLGPLLKSVLSLIKNVLKPLAKSVLVPLGLKAVDQQQMQLFIRECLNWVVVLRT